MWQRSHRGTLSTPNTPKGIRSARPFRKSLSIWIKASCHKGRSFDSNPALLIPQPSFFPQHSVPLSLAYLFHTMMWMTHAECCLSQGHLQSSNHASCPCLMDLCQHTLSTGPCPPHISHSRGIRWWHQTIIQKNTCTPMFLAALFTIART